MSNKYNILLVSCVFPPEPVVSASLSFDIAAELSKSYNVTVISPIPSRPNGMVFKEFASENYPFLLRRLKTYVGSKSTVYSRFRESHSFGLQTAKFIKSNCNNINLIYMNTWPLLAQLYTVFIAKKYSIPVVTHVQDIYPESLSPKVPFFGKILLNILLPIDRYITRYSSSLITISNGMKDLLIKTRNLTSEKVTVVFNWQDDQKFNINVKKFNKKDDYFTFMFVGSINRLANIESIIVAFKNANLKGCRLIIAGEGSEKKNLISFVEKNSIKNVKFINFDTKDIGVVQYNSDVLVLSLKPGLSSLAFPSKIPAYMFSSRPILAFVDMPSDISNTIQSANCGWVIQSGNTEELKNGFSKILTLKKSELERMGESGKKYAFTYLSRSVNLKKILVIIEGYLK
jgi:glycosyltransferase involved in cell wall biosynthesis